MRAENQDTQYFFSDALMAYFAEPGDYLGTTLEKYGALIQRENPLTFSVTTNEPDGEHKYYVNVRVAY